MNPQQGYPPPNSGYQQGNPPPSSGYQQGHPPPNSGYQQGPPPPNSGYQQGHQQGYQQGYNNPTPLSPSQANPYQGNPTSSNNDMQLMSFFRMVDTDQSGQISAIELQRALINGDWTPFSIETVCLLIDLFDRDFSGTLDFNEFRGVWGYLEQWRQLFFQFDRDRSGFLDQQELGQALRAFGFPVKDVFISNLVRKFNKHASRITGRPINQHINFDTFIRCCVEVKLANDRFKANDPQNKGTITLSYDQFMDIVANK